MEDLFNSFNLHLQDIALFAKQDPHLYRLQKQPLVHTCSLLDNLKIPGIYSLGGGRQIGKTTLLKQWMLKLLKSKVEPNNIYFLSGKMIDDHHVLLNIIQNQINNMNSGLKYLIIDEVTYIENWDKAIKYAADVGLLEDVILLLAGSDLSLMYDAKMRFPGRRGNADKVDYHLYPLSFSEVISLKNYKNPTIDELFLEFENYLKHGGYLTAINDLAKNGKISIATFTTCSDWIRGDIQKKGKQEIFLREILASIIKKYSSQITWNSLAKDLSIEHHKTVADYIDILVNMDAVFVQSAILEGKLTAAPKKAKKIFFTDPFIFHAVYFWLNSVQKSDLNTEDISKLVESVVVTHIRRLYPTYYIKAEKEIDVAYVKNNTFYPIEIKWTNQIRPQDLKQISKYKNGAIWGKVRKDSILNGVMLNCLPVMLRDYV